MLIPERIQNLMKRLEANELTKEEVIVLLTKISKVERLTSNAAFFGYDIRLNRLKAKDCPIDEVKDSQNFLNSAYRIYYQKN